MRPPNGHQTRLWALIMLLLSVLLGGVGFLLEHQLAQINARIDRVVEFVLEHQKP